jgi:hypothetical protein
MPSEVPARSQALPGRMVAVPSRVMMKSGPPANTGVPAGTPTSSSACFRTSPTRSPGRRKGGNLAGSMPSLPISSGVQM